METRKLLLGVALAGLLAGSAQTTPQPMVSTLAKTAKIVGTAVAIPVALMALKKGYKLLRKLHYWYGSKNTEITAEEIIPDKNGFLVDLDNTIVEKTSFYGLVWKNRGAIAASLKNHPQLALNLYRSGASSEEWQTEFKKHGDTTSKEHQFAGVIQQISQEKTIIKGMDTVIENIHKQGFIIQPLTNMGERDYQYLQNKYPKLFGCFTNPMYVTYDANKKAIKKPMPQYYENFAKTQAENNRNPDNKRYIFIDDKAENCTAARKVLGCDYIVVPGDKNNAAMVRATLAKYGLTV